MKSARKILILIVTLAMLFTFAGCGEGKDQSKGTKATGEAKGSAVATGTNSGTKAADQPKGKGLRVGIVTSSGVDDGNFGENCYNGIVDFCKANPGTTYNDVKQSDVGKVVQAVGEVIGDYDAMVMPGFQFAPAGEIAKANPDKFFVLIDSYPTVKEGDKDKEVTLDNMFAVQFKEQESGFFAGVAAALESKTGKVAVINGMAFPSNVNYQFGFMAGVAYANKHYGKNVTCLELPSYEGTDVNGVKVGGNYVGSFADQGTAKSIATELINQGADILFPAAGDSGNGVFAAVKEAGKDKFVIGCDVDQYDDGEAAGRNIVLTSAIKNMRPVVKDQLQKFYDGKAKGENALYGANEGATGIITEPGRQQLSEDTIKKLNEVFELVKNGTIVPPSNFSEGITVKSFPGL